MIKKTAGHPFQIGLQIHSLYDSFGKLFFENIHKCAEEKGINLITVIGETPHTPFYYYAQLSSIYQYVSPANFDGFIFLGNTILSYESPQYMKTLVAGMGSKPVVCIGCSVLDKPSIMTENRQGIYEAFSHLVKEHGKKHIAFVRGPAGNLDADERFEAYCESLRSYGMPFNENMVFHGDFTNLTGQKAIDDFKRKGLKIDAIITSNDAQAFGLIEQARLIGIRVPAEIAVIGFDNIRESEFFYPSLTTIRQPVPEMSVKAFECLMDMLGGRTPPQQTVLPTKLIIRNSCGCRFLNAGIDPASPDDLIFSDTAGDKTGILKKRLLYDLSGKGTENNDWNGIYSRTLELIELLVSQKGIMEKRKEFFEKLIYSIDDDMRLNRSISGWESAIKTLILNIDLLYETQDSRNNIQRILNTAMEYIQILLKNNEALKWIRKEYQIYDIRDSIQRIESVTDFKELSRTSLIMAQNLHYRHFYICLYDKPQYHEAGAPFEKAKSAKILASKTVSSENKSPRFRKSLFSGNQLLPVSGYPSRTRYSLIVQTVYFKEEIFGYIMFENPEFDKVMFQIFISSLSSTLKRIFLFSQKENAEKRLRGALKKLSLYNISLKDQSEKDELTGLLNRRGFLNMAKLKLKQLKEDRLSAILFFADMDGLKAINDSYGHSNGDFAIQSMAVILKKTFREKDILARLGGDEFVILANDLQKEVVNHIRERMTYHESELNSQSGKPFKISASLGHIIIKPDSHENLEYWISEADKRLYTEKKKRKISGRGN